MIAEHISDIVVSLAIILSCGSWLLGAFGSHVLGETQRGGRD